MDKPQLQDTAHLPRGTVTLLFTDIQGSTDLLHYLGQDYTRLLAEHHNIMREVFLHWDGKEIEVEGDAFFVAFANASDALNATVEAQRALAGHTWPGDVQVRVRMGLHTGETWEFGQGYAGVTVHRAARIAHIGHGGQVLLSETTTALVRSELPEGVYLKDLGSHRLKDFPRPEQIHQVSIRGLQTEFPALTSLEMSPPQVSVPDAYGAPDFLPASEEGPPFFVARGGELARLGEVLDSALAGQGGVIFIVGAAGQGKTSLMTAFARQALAAHPRLRVIQGNCNAFSGHGDPYLPFREALSQLTGDVAGQYSAAPLAPEQAQRLWQGAPNAIQQLVDHGPNLVGAMLPGRALLARARGISQEETPWLHEIQAFIERPQTRGGELPQSALFEQYSEVLRALAEEHPLIVLLDDLQWADHGSLHLLAHLGQRLAGSQVCLVGAYRSVEVALRPDGEQHRLVPVIQTFKRKLGEVTIDLQGGDGRAGRDFVDAVLDAEPNRLGSAFREQLFSRTQGHPLFTVELLRAMKNQGILARDPQLGWIARDEVHWDRLPAKIDAVIGERVDRLDERLQGILSAASVEGVIFTSQVVAEVEGLSARVLLKALNRELEAQHMLVRESGEIEVAGRYLTRYRFEHGLFQEYFYNAMSAGERRFLHGEVAAALERLYAGQTERFLPELAYHYAEAGRVNKAIFYLHKAGEAAGASYAYDEASMYLTKELALLEQRPETPESREQIMAAKISLGQVQWRSGELSVGRETLEEAIHIARELGNAQGLARAVLEYVESSWRFAVPNPALLEEALRAMGQAEESLLTVRLLTNYARDLAASGEERKGQEVSDQAIDMARRIADPLAISIAAQRREKLLVLHPEETHQRIETLKEVIAAAYQIGDQQWLFDFIGILIYNLLAIGDLEQVNHRLAELTRIAEKIRAPHNHQYIAIFQTMLALLRGDFAAAEEQAHKTYELSEQMGMADMDGIYGVQMFTIRREQDRLREVAPVVKMFVEQHSQSGAWGPGLALIYSDLGMEAECRQLFDRLAADDFAAIPKDALWGGSLAYLAEVCAFLHDRKRGAVLYDRLLPFAGQAIVIGSGVVVLGAAARFLGILAADREDWSSAGKHYRDSLKFNQGLQAAPLVAHTQYNYAAMLLARGEAEDRRRAQDLLDRALAAAGKMEMHLLGKKCRALQSGAFQ